MTKLVIDEEGLRKVLDLLGDVEGAHSTDRLRVNEAAALLRKSVEPLPVVVGPEYWRPIKTIPAEG